MQWAHLPRPRRGDVVLTLAFVVVAQAVTWFPLDSAESYAGTRALNALVAALGVMPLAWRRTAPFGSVCAGVLLICVPRVVTALDVTVLGTFVPLIVLTASVGYHAWRRLAVLGAVVALGGFLFVSLSTPFLRTPTAMGFNFLMLMGPWIAARGLREREERARRIGAELAHERATREARMSQVVSQERTRIARELHDIVAHGVSVMVVQVGGARMQLSDDLERAARSLLAAEEAGRQALADLRQLVGVLRTSAADAAAATAPPAGIDQLPMLAEQVRAAGVDVSLAMRGAVAQLPPMLDLSLYRVAQEALTNTLRHSRAKTARVVVERGKSWIRLHVTDDGPSRGLEGSGHGLVGIRERAALFGGVASAGPTAGGGWEVVVEVPVMEPAAAQDRASTTGGILS